MDDNQRKDVLAERSRELRDRIRKLEESEARWRTLVESAPVHIAWLDPDGRIRFINRTLPDLTPESVIGRSVLDFTPPDYREATTACLRRVAETGQPSGYETAYRPADDGEEQFFQVRVAPIVEEGTVIGLASCAINVTQAKKAERALRDSLETSADIVESVPSGIFIYQYEEPDRLVLLDGNPEAERMTCIRIDEWRGREFNELWPMAREQGLTDEWLEIARSGGTKKTEDLSYRDERINVAMKVYVFSMPGRRLGVAFEDILERKQLEEQLRQSQKMEAIGQLAGGMAHDFNHILSVIVGQSELMLGSLDAESQLAERARATLEAAHRAASLTRKLLAFGRKQVLQPRVLDLNSVVTDLHEILPRLIGEDVELITVDTGEPVIVRADPVQIQQVMINLATNACDAMPEGGRLTIETRYTSHESVVRGQRVELAPGRYATLSVTDTGSGMTGDVVDRIFEPFFTTKTTGSGTGLGLSTAYGIVKQSGGDIDVRSEPGRGTTFTLYFPSHEGETPEAGWREPEDVPVCGGTETVLVVEDEPSVADLIATTLEAHGYTVLEARDGTHALELFRENDGKFDLLLTDVIMPKMGGHELARQLTAERPDLKILFASGYSEDAVARQGVLPDDVHLIEKPFSPASLLHRVRKVLDEG